ncbi:MAG TPA: GAP family protein [Acidimicrobiales bacterium]
MSQGISEILTFAVGVAISPVPIIAVILMLFSARAKVNGPMFLLGWAAALAVVSFAVYFAADAGDPATSSGASDAISWGQVVLGALLVVLALRTWRKRPAPGEQPDMPKWMGGIDGLAPGKALGLGLLLAGPNPKNLLLTVGAATSLSQLGLDPTDAVVSLIVFVVVGSLTIGLPVLYYLVGGDRAHATLDDLKAWLTLHNDAVMTVLFLVFGVKLIATAIPPLTG